MPNVSLSYLYVPLEFFLLIFLFVSVPEILFDWVPILNLYSEIFIIDKGNEHINIRQLKCFR